MNSPNPDSFDIEGFSRRIRPPALHAGAVMGFIFPPESPTSARRGGSKLALDQATRDAVCAILDAMMDLPGDPMIAEFQAAMKSADAGFFRMMAEAADYAAAAAEHMDELPRGVGTFAKHVIAARIVAADLMTEDCPRPSWRKVRQTVFDMLKNKAYTIKSPEWSRVKKAAGLTDLTR